MQRLEVSCAVRRIYTSLRNKGLMAVILYLGRKYIYNDSFHIYLSIRVKYDTHTHTHTLFSQDAVQQVTSFSKNQCSQKSHNLLVSLYEICKFFYIFLGFGKLSLQDKPTKFH